MAERSELFCCSANEKFARFGLIVWSGRRFGFGLVRSIASQWADCPAWCGRFGRGQQIELLHKIIRRSCLWRIIVMIITITMTITAESGQESAANFFCSCGAHWLPAPGPSTVAELVASTDDVQEAGRKVLHPKNWSASGTASEPASSAPLLVVVVFVVSLIGSLDGSCSCGCPAAAGACGNSLECPVVSLSLLFSARRRAGRPDQRTFAPPNERTWPLVRSPSLC